MSSTGYYPQDIPHCPQKSFENLGYILWVHPVDNILYPVENNSPQDIKCRPQDITHRISHTVLRNLLKI